MNEEQKKIINYIFSKLNLEQKVDIFEEFNGGTFDNENWNEFKEYIMGKN